VISIPHECGCVVIYRVWIKRSDVWRSWLAECHICDSYTIHRHALYMTVNSLEHHVTLSWPITINLC